jgi:hypothetical protein
MNDAAKRQYGELVAFINEQTREGHTRNFWLIVTEEQCADLAAGVTPQVVQVMARSLLDYAAVRDR